MTEMTKIPVKYVGGLPDVLEKYAGLSGKSAQKPEQIPIRVYTRPEWLDITVE